MNTTFATEAAQQHDIRALAISLLGPLVAVAGTVWATLQPDRITLLHPRGQGFCWLAADPPLYVVAAGIVFTLVVARPLLDDLERHRATTR